MTLKKKLVINFFSCKHINFFECLEINFFHCMITCLIFVTCVHNNYSLKIFPVLRQVYVSLITL